MLYALSIGFSSKDQLKKEDLRFTYENDPKFSCFPIFPVATVLRGIENIPNCAGLPEVNPMNAVHGEQRLEIIQPLPPGTRVTP